MNIQIISGNQSRSLVISRQIFIQMNDRWVEIQSYSSGIHDSSRLSTARRTSLRASEGLASPATPSSTNRKRILTRPQPRPNTAPAGSNRLTPRAADFSLAVDWGALYASYVAVKPLTKIRSGSVCEATTDTSQQAPSQPASPLRRAAWSAPATRTTGTTCLQPTRPLLLKPEAHSPEVYKHRANHASPNACCVGDEYS